MKTVDLCATCSGTVTVLVELIGFVFSRFMPGIETNSTGNFFRVRRIGRVGFYYLRNQC